MDRLNSLNHLLATPRRKRIIVSMAGLGLGVGLGACASTEQSVDFKPKFAKVVDGTFEEGANIRMDPNVLADSGDGSTNACARLPENLILENQLTYVIPDTVNPENGEWVAFPLENSSLPNNIKEKCNDDSDGIVYISTITGDIDVSKRAKSVGLPQGF